MSNDNTDSDRPLEWGFFKKIAAEHYVASKA